MTAADPAAGASPGPGWGPGDGDAGADPSLGARVRAFLDEHACLSLATAGTAGPWAATVFYALADDGEGGLALLFFTHERSRHGRDLGERARAAAAINAQHVHWSTIRGVQLEGEVERLHGEERAEALQVLVDRFPWLSEMATSTDEQERRIAARLTTTSVYRLRAERAVLTDNARFFGSREELALGSQQQDAR